MTTTMNDIREWIDGYDKDKYSHVIIVSDSFEYEEYPVAVKIGEDVKSTISEYNGKNMQRVMEVYNLSMDIEKQIAGGKCWNDQPYEPEVEVITSIEKDDNNGFDEFGRPSWTHYFISLAFLIAQRSLDESTKCGAVVVAKDNTILSVGYNGPPRGCDDSLVPQTRPEKYLWFLHAEEAAIVNAARSGICLKGATFYITGAPCARCVRKMISVGAEKIIFGGVNAKCVDKEDEKAIRDMMKDRDIEMVKIDGKNIFKDIMLKSIKYIEDKS